MQIPNTDTEHEVLHKNDFNGNISIAKTSIAPYDTRKAILRQEFMVFLINFGLLTGGICLALPAVTLDQLTRPGSEIYLNASEASWYASCSLLACPIGGILCALMADRYGRKVTLIVTNFIGIFAWALMAFPLKGSQSHFIFFQLMASRMMAGTVRGMGGAPAANYGAEISLPRVRARLIMAVSMIMACGVLMIYILGYFIRNNLELLGMVLLGYQTIALMMLIPVPESPSWLLSKGHLREAKKSLSFFRGLRPGETHKEVELEFNLLMTTFRDKRNKASESLLGSLRLPQVYKPFILALVFYVLQQFAGTFVIIVYAVQILSKSGFQIDPFLCAVYIGIARFFVATFVMTWQLETWTRRQVGISSAVSMALCMFLLALSDWFTWLHIPYLPLVVVVAFVVCCAGIWALPFVICAEIFPQNVRGACCGITDAFAYFMSFLATKWFPAMVEKMGSGSVFAFYGAMALLTGLFIFVYIPETKDKTLLEIGEFFQGKRRDGGEESKLNGEEMREFVVKVKS